MSFQSFKIYVLHHSKMITQWVKGNKLKEYLNILRSTVTRLLPSFRVRVKRKRPLSFVVSRHGTMGSLASRLEMEGNSEPGSGPEKPLKL